MRKHHLAGLKTASTYAFPDYKGRGLIAAAGGGGATNSCWETILNARDDVRKLPDADKDGLPAGLRRFAEMMAQPSMTKSRAEDNGRLIVGFKPEIYARGLAETDVNPPPDGDLIQFYRGIAAANAPGLRFARNP